MNDLQEQVKVEHAPTDKNEHGQEVSHWNKLVNSQNQRLNQLRTFKFDKFER